MIYKIKDFIKRLYFGYRFFIRGFQSRTYDANEMYLDMALRLELCYDQFIKDDLYCWCDSENSRQMRSIRELINLNKRLYNLDILNSHTIKLMDKYKDCEKDRFGLYKNAKLIDKKLFRFFFKKACEKDRIMYNSLKERHMFEIGSL